MDNELPIQISKKNNIKKILTYIVVIVISAGASGFGVWFFMNQNNNNDKTVLLSQIAAKESSISDLQKTVASQIETIAKGTASAITTTNTDDITTLKSFCATSSETVGNFFYASVSSGVYGGCDMANAAGVGGSYKITKKVNNAWTLVLDGQQFSAATLKANSIPTNFVVTPNNYRLLQ